MATAGTTKRTEHAAAEIHYDGRDLEILATMERYHRWIFQQFRPFVRGHAVEYGAGTGTFSQLLIPHVDELDLVEPSSVLAAKLRNRCRSVGHAKIYSMPLEKHIQGLKSASVDTIMLINVLEHVEDDVSALKAFVRVLKPSGHLLLFVPALAWLFSALDRRYGHYRRYHRRPLARMVSAAGFEIVVARYMDILGVVPWWLLNTVGEKTEFEPGLIKLYDRIGVPLTRAIESFMPPPFGKNIILIAQRPPT